MVQSYWTLASKMSVQIKQAGQRPELGSCGRGSLGKITHISKTGKALTMAENISKYFRLNVHMMMKNALFV